MRVRGLVVSGIVLALCTAGMLIPAVLSNGIGNMLLAHPAELGAPRINIQKIEDFMENEFLLSYEIPSPERASLTHAEYPVTVIGTNSSYPMILGYMMTEGSFFSKQAWTGKLKYAVLNEKAAFTIFGSSRIAGNRFRLRNDTWLVTGIIRDGDDGNPKVYIPSSLEGGEAASLMAQVSGGFDEAYIINSLKTLGIQEGNYKYYSLRIQSRVLWERPLIILCLFAGFSLISFLRPLAKELKKTLAVLKKELDRNYPEDILRNSRRFFLKPVLLSLLLALIPVITLLLILRVTALCLPWQDIPSLAALNRDLFYPLISGLKCLELISRLFFILSLAALPVFLITLNKKR